MPLEGPGPFKSVWSFDETVPLVTRLTLELVDSCRPDMTSKMKQL